jgi:hypothetical protein
VLRPDRHRALRERACALVDGELQRLREAGPGPVGALARREPVEAQREGVLLTTRVEADGDLLMVLVEAFRGRRVLATGGFAMGPDGTTHTPR